MATLTDIHSGPVTATERITLWPERTPLLIRAAHADDTGAVRRMHLRSSPLSRQRRYLSGVLCPSEANLRRLLVPAGGITFLVTHRDPRGDEEQVIAMANLLPEGVHGEIAMLVEDAWQRRGIGSRLLRGLIAYAARAGFPALVAHTELDNLAMLRTLRRLGFGPARRDGRTITMTRPAPDHR